MRLSIAAILLSGWIAQSAHAQLPSEQADIANEPARVALQEPFRMPPSEQKAIADNPSWTAPQKPFRIYENTWYVGPHGLTVVLITARTGHVLIDGGVPGDASLIEANIRNLGIDLYDIKWILNSHAHFDHAGDIAQLARDTGAQVISSVADAPLLERGGYDDAQYGDRFPFAPVHVSRTVKDGESLHLGELVLTAHSRPGHTRGNTTWTWTSCDGGERCLHIADVGSLSAPGYQLIGNPKYPDIVKDFEYSFAMVPTLPCDIALNPHPATVNLWSRVAKRDKGDADALIDSGGCRAYAKVARESFESELARQRLSNKGQPPVSAP
jgi:metallo-beta-lactamase class B